MWVWKGVGWYIRSLIGVKHVSETTCSDSQKYLSYSLFYTLKTAFFEEIECYIILILMKCFHIHNWGSFRVC